MNPILPGEEVAQRTLHEIPSGSCLHMIPLRKLSAVYTLHSSLELHWLTKVLLAMSDRPHFSQKKNFLREIESNCDTRVYCLCAGLEVPGRVSQHAKHEFLRCFLVQSIIYF